MKRLHSCATTLLLISMSAAPAMAQQPSPGDASRLYATRDQLQAMLDKFEQGSRIEGYSEQVRQIVNDEADLIRTRLTDGDIQVGDQVQLMVSGMQSLTGTFTVTDGRVLVLPDVGAVPLAGLLRSEVQEGIRTHLAKYSVDPQVFARTSVRLSVWGAVGSPGYMVVPADNLLTEVLATAGQPSSTAKPDDIKIKRGDEVIWDGEALEMAIVEGRTIDQMNLRAGDRIEVPGKQQGTGFLSNVLMSMRYVLPLVFLINRIW